MNSETYDTCRAIAEQAGAIGPCPDCQMEAVYFDDSDANSRAYALMTNAWKANESGLRGMSREEATAAMQTVLRDATQKCQTCNQDRDD